ncbi:FAD-dependent oxidoreductase [Zhongshania arctica]|uniref:FAD-dependent oxidoreductase n=1 Tax=Zhongshania arctica TaxID=3238302 RepID=A0ABV3TTE1_9GAMM
MRKSQELVLIGGGHAHVFVLKLWGLNPLAGVKITLISSQQQTPYSGMLPGLVAGHYTVPDAHIDLVGLCKFAGATFIQGSVTEINLKEKELQVDDSEQPIKFDLLSINSGITPNLDIAGAKDFSTAVKPISEFYPRWQHTLQELSTASTEKSIAVVGGGAAGVELVLAMQYAISQRPDIKVPVKLQLVYRGEEPLSNFPSRIRNRVLSALSNADIQLKTNCDVSKLSLGTIHCDAMPSIKSDHIFWCTNANAAAWPKTSGLETDNRGFISVDDTLQSRSHDFVFAAGDIAQQYNHPRPHAGVFAVRQGPVLFRNLQNKLKNQHLESHRPQRHFLGILALGDKDAIAHRRFWPAIHGRWVWLWKDAIDRRFMAKFSDLN